MGKVFKYKLPEGACGTNVLLQWRYITANSCFPPGYKNTAVGQELLELGWLRASGMSDCQYPYDPTGATGSGKPEQFWNCAEITIECSNPTVSPAPTPPPQPTPEPKPTSSPTKAPVVVPGPGYCNYGGTHDSSREKCDGKVEGGDWCNENQSQCEGSCNGNWYTVGAPTPVTLSPTASPTFVSTMSPSDAPTAKATQCSEDPDDEFFFKLKNNGKPAFKTCQWLANKNEGKIDKLCTTKTDSHGDTGPPGDVCKVTCGKCPTSSPTKAKTPSPTKSPTEPVTGAPTKAPTKAPTSSPTEGDDRCCSQFFDVCKPNPWCQESESNCKTCNGVFLTNLPKQCIPRFGMCSGNEDGCCYPSTCTSANDNSKQCMYSPP